MPDTQNSQSGSRQKPKISVMIITYNHAQYIAQAIESVISQKTTHSYEIQLGDVCSASAPLRQFGAFA